MANPHSQLKKYNLPLPRGPSTSVLGVCQQLCSTQTACYHSLQMLGAGDQGTTSARIPINNHRQRSAVTKLACVLRQTDKSIALAYRSCYKIAIGAKIKILTDQPLQYTTRVADWWPDTSCLWPESFFIPSLHLMSLCMIVRSRLPEERRSAFQASAPTRAVCPVNEAIFLLADTSHICTSPLWVPTAT